eukprot:UN32046
MNPPLGTTTWRSIEHGVNHEVSLSLSCADGENEESGGACFDRMPLIYCSHIDCQDEIQFADKYCRLTCGFCSIEGDTCAALNYSNGLEHGHVIYTDPVQSDEPFQQGTIATVKCEGGYYRSPEVNFVCIGKIWSSESGVTAILPQCISCSPGQYGPGGTEVCMDCTPGKFNDGS